MENQGCDNVYCPSDIESSTYFDFDAFLDMDLIGAPRSKEGLLSEVQPTTEETQTIPVKATDPIRDIAPHVLTTKASEFGSIDPTPKSIVQTPLENITERGDDALKAEVESEQKQKEIFQRLRRYLQNGLLSTDEQPKKETMEVMSSYLKELENVGKPSQSALDATKIRKLLRKIKRQEQIPSDFSKRIVKLLKRWEAKGNLIIPSVSQPIENHDTGVNTVRDERESMDASGSQQLHDSNTKVSTTPLSGISSSNPSFQPEQSAKDHEVVHVVAPAKPHSLSTPPLSPILHELPKFISESPMIDLTSDNEEYLDVASELPRQRIIHPAVGSNVDRRMPPIGSLSPSSECWKHQVSNLNSDSDKPQMKKRRRSDKFEKPVIMSSREKTLEGNYSPKRSRPQRTSPTKHYTNELKWMSMSIPGLCNMIKEAEKDIIAIREKKIRLLEQNEAEMKSAKRRKKESTDLKYHLLAWGARDEEVTNEWSPSE